MFHPPFAATTGPGVRWEDRTAGRRHSRGRHRNAERSRAGANTALRHRARRRPRSIAARLPGSERTSAPVGRASACVSAPGPEWRWSALRSASTDLTKRSGGSGRAPGVRLHPASVRHRSARKTRAKHDVPRRGPIRSFRMASGRSAGMPRPSSASASNRAPAQRATSAASRRPRQTRSACTVSATSWTRSTCAPSSAPRTASASDPPRR